MRWPHVMVIGLWLGGVVALATRASSEQSMSEQPGDAARGKLVFEHRCTGCHALDADREGPRLRDVYGRKVGNVAGFEYSESLRHSGWIWNTEMLERWLTDPDIAVPGNNMSFATPKAQDRKDLIAFLQQAAESK